MTLDIMMPFYGRPDHFRLAVESVLAQTDAAWRLVVVDDVYPDEEPGRWVQSLGDPRIDYIRNEQNLRPSRNYRKCVGLMENSHAVIMGCDDIMRPGYVARMAELVKEFPEAATFQPGVDLIDEDGKPVRPIADRVKAFYRWGGARPREDSGEALATSLTRGNWTYFPSLCWQVEALRRHEFRLDLDVVQDLAMLLDIAMDGGSLVLDDELVFSYRRHSASVSAVTGPDGSKYVQERTLFTDVEKRFVELGWRRAARVARTRLSSRLHAATELPAGLRAPGSAGTASLLRHVFGR